MDLSTQHVVTPPSVEHRRSKHFSTFVSTFVVLGLMAGAAWWLVSQNQKAALERSTSRRISLETAVVTAQSVTARQVQRTVSVVGSLFGQEEIVIRPKVGGRVVEIVHETGDRVVTGDVLLRIERTEYELAVAEAQRALESELSKLGLTSLPGDDFDSAQLPSVIRARVEEQNMLSKLNRIRDLSKRQVLAGEELDTAETNYTVARANLQQMRMDAQSMLATARHRQAALNTALQRLAESDVVVPAPGRRGTASDSKPPQKQEYVVSDRAAGVGEIISATAGNDPGIFSLVIDNPLKLVTTLPERHRSEVRVGQQVDLRVEYFPSTMFPGTVSRINPVVDRATRTFEVEIAVPNTDRRLSPGSFVRASIQTHLDESAPTVPEQSLVKLAGVTKVFVIRDGVAREVQVKIQGKVVVTGSSYAETWAEVEGDLPVGAAIATSGFAHLSDGCPVKIREATAVAEKQQESRP